MSLFLPSQLSPNFEEVLIGEPIIFNFQVNTNGSEVRSWKLEILNDENDAEDPEDNILATFNGVFSAPLYNKEIGAIIITENKLEIQGLKLQSEKKYRWRVRLYEDYISEWAEDNNQENNSVQLGEEQPYNTTYVGAGNIVGTTKNVIWLSHYDNIVAEGSYVESVLCSDNVMNDFKPFKNTTDNFQYDYADPKGPDKLAININNILPSYREKIADGHMYIQQVQLPNQDYIAEDLCPKLIRGLSYEGGITYIHINPNEWFIGDVPSSGMPYCLVYIQRQQIYSVDYAIGQKQLTKVLLDEPMDYNTSHNMSMSFGLVSDNFDYDRVYIKPIDEFDSDKVGNTYIKLAYNDSDLLNTAGLWSKEDLQDKGAVKIINYVAKTGEVTLYSKLNYKPNRMYMYQIFILDTTQQDYGVNPQYKYLTGTMYENSVINSRYFLGGTVGYLWSSSKQLPVYSNNLTIDYTHEGKSWFYYELFIQPNLGIYEDQNRPVSLQIYNNKIQMNGYITNKALGQYGKWENNDVIYDKNISLDKLDDSQWLITLYVATEYLDQYDNLLFPQTKYKIYTNFVNSIPEGYFYVGNPKTLSFKYYNAFDTTLTPTTSNVSYKKNISDNIWYKQDDGQWYKQVVDTESNQLQWQTTTSISETGFITALPFKDLLIKCDIHDQITGQQHSRNIVPIKFYKWIIGCSKNGNDLEIIDESNDIYDSKFEYIIRGLESCLDDCGLFSNDIKYVIEFMAVDEYGREYILTEQIYINYIPQIINDKITAIVNCDTQSIHINFSPVKSFYAEGNVIPLLNANNIIGSVQTMEEGITFEELHDTSDNNLSIPEQFVMYFKMKIAEAMLYESSNVYTVFNMITDNGSEYRIDFDTRIYIMENNQFVLNDNYLAFMCYKNNELKKVFTPNNYDGEQLWSLESPTGFTYGIHAENQVTENAIYLLSTTPNIVADNISTQVNEQEQYDLTVNDELQDIHNNYYIKNTDEANNVFKIHSNEDSIADNIFNLNNAKKMSFIYFKIDSSASDNTIFMIDINKID